MHSTYRTEWSTSAARNAEPKVATRSHRSEWQYKNGGVLCTARTGRDGRRQEKKVQNPTLRKGAIIRSGRYNNGEVLRTARTVRNDQGLQEMQNRRLQQGSTVRSGRYKNGGVLCTARTGREVDVCSIKCRTESCGKQPSFRVAGTKTGSTVRSTHRTG